MTKRQARREVALAGDVLVVGLGRRGGGTGVVRHLAADPGCSVTVVDDGDRDTFADIDDLEAEMPGVRFLFASDAASVSVTDFDVIVRNPAVPFHTERLEEARAAVPPIPIVTEATIFLDAFPGRTIGVTGSKGKTSTCYFLTHLLGGRPDGEPVPGNPDVRMVGNMGGSALEALEGATESTTAVYELSSFQTESLDEHGITTEVACLTSLHPDHLTAYDDEVDRYYDAKAPLFTLQGEDDWRIHVPVEELPRPIVAGSPARWVAIGRDHPDAEVAVWLDQGAVHLRRDGRSVALIAADAIPVEGEHRMENVLVAVAGAAVLGTADADLVSRLPDLPPVPHRMEPIPVSSSVRWINDTAATNPTAAKACLDSLSSPAGERTLIAICGGESKHIGFQDFVDAVVDHRVVPVLLPGNESALLRDLLEARGAVVHGPTASMVDAVKVAAGLADAAGPGERIVTLTPGWSSVGHFVDEFDRGGQFIAAVLLLHGVAVDEEQVQILARSRRRPIDTIVDL